METRPYMTETYPLLVSPSAIPYSHCPFGVGRMYLIVPFLAHYIVRLLLV